MKQVMYYIIIAVLLYAIYGATNLSMNDFREKDICPKLLNIPACYIVVIFFVMALISHLTVPATRGNTIYYIFLSVPFLMALGATVMELSGTEICPRTAGGTPMCYFSLGLCSTLFLLKFVEIFYNGVSID